MEINNHSRKFCSKDWKWQTSRSLPQTKGKFCSWKLSSLLAIVPWEKPLTQGPLPLGGIFQRRLWNFVNYDPMLQRQALPQLLPGSHRGAAQSSHIRHSANYKTATWQPAPLLLVIPRFLSEANPVDKIHRRIFAGTSFPCPSVPLLSKFH